MLFFIAESHFIIWTYQHVLPYLLLDILGFVQFMTIMNWDDINILVYIFKWYQGIFGSDIILLFKPIVFLKYFCAQRPLI